MNVSLTAISLLWNASDLLGKLYNKARNSSRSSLEAEPLTNGNTSSSGAQLDSEQYQELVRLLYGALQVSGSTSPCISFVLLLDVFHFHLGLTCVNGMATSARHAVRCVQLMLQWQGDGMIIVGPCMPILLLSATHAPMLHRHLAHTYCRMQC